MSEVAWIAPNHASRFGGTILQPHEEQHYSIRHWARRWGFSEKTVREWFRDEYGPGILRQSNTGRRRKRGYTTVRISASAASRVYEKRIGGRKPPEVM